MATAKRKSATAPKKFSTPAAEFSTTGGKTTTASVLGKPFPCQVCGHTEFHTRHSLLNTVGMTMMDWEWLNREATNLICARCGYIHWFAA